jgi:hypothetical protein
MNMKKDKYRSDNYLLTVWNDENGWNIIKKLKENHSLKLRGRHPNRKLVMKLNGLKPNHCNDIPVNLSQTIAVYLRKS